MTVTRTSTDSMQTEPAAPFSAAPARDGSARRRWRHCSRRNWPLGATAAATTAGRWRRRWSIHCTSRQGQAGHLALHGRRAVAPRDVRLQAEAGRDERPADARVVHQGPADRPAPGPEAQLLRARSIRSRSTASRARRSVEIFPHIGSSRRRHLHHPLDAHRSDQPRPGPHLHEHRHDHLRPARMGSWLLYGLGSESENLPGFVVLVSDGQVRPDPADRRAAVAQRLSAQPVPGRRIPLARATRCSMSHARRASAAETAATTIVDAVNALESAQEAG